MNKFKEILSEFFKDEDSIIDGTLEIEVKKISIPANNKALTDLNLGPDTTYSSHTLNVDEKFIKDNQDRLLRTTDLGIRKRHKATVEMIKQDMDMNCVVVNYTREPLRRPKYYWADNKIIEKYYFFNLQTINF